MYVAIAFPFLDNDALEYVRHEDDRTVRSRCVLAYWQLSLTPVQELCQSMNWIKQTSTATLIFNNLSI